MPSERRCPCGSGSQYIACCGPLHDGRGTAETALALMRSRFSAFALGHADYLLTTWHRDTRPRRLELDDDIVWRRLQIVDTDAGGRDDDNGVVEFRAQYERHGKRGLLRERSRFTRSGGRWVYVDGDVED